MEITCPSGLRGEIRPLTVADEDYYIALASDQKTIADAETLVCAGAWMQTLDPGPYPGETDPKALNPDKRLLADLTWVELKVRELAWGPMVRIEVSCRRGHKTEGEVDVRTCTARPMHPDAVTLFRRGEPMSVTLDDCGRTVKFVLATREVARGIIDAARLFPKDRLSAAMSARVVSIEGFDPESGLDKETQMDQAGWLKTLTARDGMRLREAFGKYDPDVDTMTKVPCGEANCGEVTPVNVVLAPDFFVPAAASRTS